MKKNVFFLNLNAIAMLFVLFFSTGTYADCTKNIDCKDNRICEKGICVDSGQTKPSQLNNQTNNNVQKTIIAQDGRFTKYADGTVLDTQTNLMWAAHDNGSNINWYDAKSYCENYRGGGYTDWRMPTQDELAGLFDADKTYTPNCGGQVHLTELIYLTCCLPWALETRGSEAALFGFLTGTRYWNPQSFAILHRALPVRSGKQIIWLFDHFLFPVTGAIEYYKR